MANHHQSAFSLVELSIVLVILGLLTGGILSGQNLIRAAELRKTITVAEHYRTAIFSFRDQYGGLPGDLRNGTAFWPDSADGDGDGWIEAGSTSGSHPLTSPDNPMFDGERAQAFVQLSKAGLIEGGYDGTAVLGKGYPVVPLAPSKGMMLTGPWTTGGGSGILFPDPAAIFTGSLYLSMIICNPSRLNDHSAFNDCSDMFRPQDVWSMDKKTDDGLPHRGAVLGYPRYAGRCINVTLDAYDLSDDSVSCGGMFRKIL
jgi:prepilin-type N-terminal cleavage/methylation domain-containing protein